MLMPSFPILDIKGYIALVQMRLMNDHKNTSEDTNEELQLVI